MIALVVLGLPKSFSPQGPRRSAVIMWRRAAGPIFVATA